MGEQSEFFEEIKDEINKIIDEICEKYGTDRAYYEFVLICCELSNNFEPMEKHTLINDHNAYCVFCGKRTYFYVAEEDMHMCAKCYGDYKKK